MPPTPSFANEAYDPDRLLAGDHSPITEDVTIITGENLVRGAVVGRITVSGKYNLSLSTAGDGSEVPVGVMADAVDATAADKVGPVYFAGEFNEDALTLGASHTIASIRQALRGLSIYLKNPVSE